MKKANVCKGCKYYIRFYGENICDYTEQTGHSRIMVENENDGYRKDTCVCYKKGTSRGRKVQVIV